MVEDKQGPVTSLSYAHECFVFLSQSKSRGQRKERNIRARNIAIQPKVRKAPW